jgi:hypothetical protein
MHGETVKFDKAYGIWLYGMKFVARVYGVSQETCKCVYNYTVLHDIQ